MAIQFWESMTRDQMLGFLFALLISGGFLTAMIVGIIEHEMAKRKKPQEEDIAFPVEPTIPRMKPAVKVKAGKRQQGKKTRGKVQWL